MANVTLNDLTSNYGSQALLNENFQTIEDALNDDVLYKTGTEANAMQRSLDMNSNKIINVADGVVNTDGVSLAQLNGAIGAASSGLIASQTETQLGSQAVANVFTFVGILYTLGANNLEVFRNGVRQERTEDYTETSTSSITLTFTPNSTDRFVFRTNTATTNSINATAAVTHTEYATTVNLETYLQNHNRINVKDFGAVADGATDDGPAFQAAIDFGVSNLLAIYVPSGIYNIGQTLNFTGNDVTFIGESLETVFLQFQQSVTGTMLDVNPGGAARRLVKAPAPSFVSSYCVSARVSTTGEDAVDKSL